MSDDIPSFACELPRDKIDDLPFSDLPQDRKEKLYGKVKAKIDEAGGLFYTWHLIHGQNGSLDFYFLGKEPGSLYTCVMATAKTVFTEEVRRLALHACNAIAPDKANWMKRAKRNPQTGFMTVQIPPDKPLAKLGGLTRSQWQEKKRREIIDADTVQVYEEAALDLNFSVGTGLIVTLNVPAINETVVREFIDKFLSEGEIGWRNEVPVSFSNEDISDWSIDSNFIVAAGT